VKVSCVTAPTQNSGSIDLEGTTLQEFGPSLGWVGPRSENCCGPS
jgi:hypothetical protein